VAAPVAVPEVMFPSLRADEGYGALDVNSSSWSGDSSRSGWRGGVGICVCVKGLSHRGHLEMKGWAILFLQ